MKFSVITTVFALSGLLISSAAMGQDAIVDGLKESPEGRAAGRGLTGSIGYAVGALSTRPDSGESSTHAWAGGPASIGYFVSNNTALLLRLSSQSRISTEKYGRASYSFSPFVEHWFSERLFCGIGAGLALDLQQTGEEKVSTETGIAVPLALGLSVINLERASFRVSLQATPSFYKDYKDVSVGLVGDLVIF